MTNIQTRVSARKPLLFKTLRETDAEESFRDLSKRILLRILSKKTEMTPERAELARNEFAKAGRIHYEVESTVRFAGRASEEVAA